MSIKVSKLQEVIADQEVALSAARELAESQASSLNYYTARVRKLENILQDRCSQNFKPILFGLFYVRTTG